MEIYANTSEMLLLLIYTFKTNCISTYLHRDNKK